MTLHTCADYFDDDLVDVAATLNETRLKSHVKPLGT
ncbi:hypothetical protein IWX88_000564 [Frigoribacterium sp. CG_9.8]|nr:hypothetical protein [Frigoribacterium sp. CG_9.8]